MLETYFDEDNELSDAKRKKIELKYDSNNLFLKTYNYDLWFKNEELTDREESVDLSDMPALEGDEKEVKEEKGLKISTPNKLLTIISTNKSMKQFKQVKKWNQTNTISFVSA